MIILIIGGAGAGKSTYAVKHYLKDKATYYDSPVKYTMSGTNLLMGDYTNKKRLSGPDLIDRKSNLYVYHKIIKRYYHQFENIVLEGEYFCNKETIDELAGYNVKIILLSTPIEIRRQRFKNLNQERTEEYLEYSDTNSKDIYNYALSKGFNGEIK